MQASRQVRSVVRRTEPHEATIHFGCLATGGERSLMITVSTMLLGGLDQLLRDGRRKLSLANLAVNKSQAHTDTHRKHDEGPEHCAPSLFDLNGAGRNSGCVICHDTWPSSE